MSEAHIRFQRAFLRNDRFPNGLLYTNIQVFYQIWHVRKNGTKVIIGIRDEDFVSVTPFEVNDEKIISEENIVSAITCHFPSKIFQKKSHG